MPRGKLGSPILFICDLQERFRVPIYKFSQCIATAQKLVKACDAMSVPIYITTQNRARLGDTVSELSHAVAVAAGIFDKSRFSMVVPELERAAGLAKDGERKKEVAIVGIESHVCVLMTVLDLLRLGHKVYVIADGVSSCNKQETPVALARMRSEGAIITTSESWMFEVLGDASAEEFRTVSTLIKETSESTKEALQSLL